jgi:hypothetical protein
MVREVLIVNLKVFCPRYRSHFREVDSLADAKEPHTLYGDHGLGNHLSHFLFPPSGSRVFLTDATKRSLRAYAWKH